MSRIAVRRRVVPPGFRWRIYQDDTDVVDPETQAQRLGIELITGRQAKEGEVIHNILRAAIRRDNGESGKTNPTRRRPRWGYRYAHQTWKLSPATTLIFDVRVGEFKPFVKAFFDEVQLRTVQKLQAFAIDHDFHAFVFKHDVFRRRFVNNSST
ncbi:Uncharacterised protein [Escherichia coli]|uniref:Uncharacterized protein n=1 Tax=Escherichia coli TaxID=562 RepID=A0A376W7E3_ECOLX|nr:Uncharacterised protein [Escherichia coli]